MDQKKYIRDYSKPLQPITNNSYYDKTLYYNTNMCDQCSTLLPSAGDNNSLYDYVCPNQFYLDNHKIFILITGSYDVPQNIQYGKKSKDRESYLEGVYHDIKNLKIQLQNKRDVEVFVLENRVATCSQILEFLFSILSQVNGSYIEFVLYYTGHGATDGSWCFTDGTLSPKEIRQFLNSKNCNHKFFKIISDSCYSGKFGQQCVQYLSKFCITSCQPDELSYDSATGGLFTKWLCGEKVKFQKQQPMGFICKGYF